MDEPSLQKPHGRCGARTRAGHACKRRPARGKKRCRMHGGAVGSGRPRVHGLYVQAFTDEERGILDDAKGAGLGEELALVRITLRRLLKVAPPPVGEGVAGEDGPDWWSLLDRLTGRVAKLAESRARLEELVQLAVEVSQLREELNAR